LALKLQYEGSNVVAPLIGEQRHGPTGTVNLQFEAAVTRFDNLERDSPRPQQI
jgi:replicative DNA helicase